MFKLSLEQISDLPDPSILVYLRSKGEIQSKEYNELGSGLRNGERENIITALKSYSRDYLLEKEDRQIVQNPDFISTFKLPNSKLIQMISEQNNGISIFTNKAEMLRCLLRSNGDLMTFGSNQFGQLGFVLNFRVKPRPTSVQSEINEKVRSVSCGGYHTAVITENGNLITFGSIYYDRLGPGDQYNSIIPQFIYLESDEKVRSVSCGENHIAIITENNKLMTFGSNDFGQLGLGDFGRGTERPVPTLVNLEEKVKIVNCGYAHTAIITESGKLMTFGNNFDGQLGLNDRINRSVPTLVNLEEKVKIVNCGYVHTAIITENGELMTFGSNSKTQLGLGDSGVGRDRLVPTLVKIPNNERVKMVSCGHSHTAIITESGPRGPMLGQLMTFGSNSVGQLGLGHEERRSRPTLVELDKQVKMISCGEYHTAIITNDGKLMTFGDNRNGQLGNGKFGNQVFGKSFVVVPTLVESVKDQNVKMVRCGKDHTAIIVESLD